ncbi:hypothetical protein [Chlorogloeopsis fritschii]|nr:hypothetical protein [Chlorogloeopsis fritschii]
MTKLQALSKQANNPNAPEQSQVIGELQRFLCPVIGVVRQISVLGVLY